MCSAELGRQIEDIEWYCEIRDSADALRDVDELVWTETLWF